MRIAYLEPVGGLSGDMFLGALVDAGLPVETLNDMIERLGLDGVTVSAEPVVKTGISATQVSVHAHGHGHDHGHSHDHHHGLGPVELAAIVEASDLDEDAIVRSVAIIWRIAEAEAKIHDSTPEEVHFHELGGLDTVVDVCGAVIGLAELGIERLYCGPLPMGHGFVECAHGRLPLPAPATAELLIGAPTAAVDIEGETVTPTGAALAVMLADEFARPPEMTVQTIGYGAGNADFSPTPNVVRLSLGESAGVAEAVEVVVIEANVDDMNPELAPHAIEAMLSARALDAWATPIVMKKGRPALTISALAEPEDAARIADVLLRETTSLGVRMSSWRRRCLARETVTVQTQYGPLRVKLGLMDGRVVTVSPEYEDCRAAAISDGTPLKEVYAAAQAAAYDV